MTRDQKLRSAFVNLDYWIKVQRQSPQTMRQGASPLLVAAEFAREAMAEHFGTSADEVRAQMAEEHMTKMEGKS